MLNLIIGDDGLYHGYDSEYTVTIYNETKEEMEDTVRYLKNYPKSVPKAPGYEADGYADGELVYDTWICPGCGKHYEIECEKYDYCPNCGQRIKWEEDHD